VKKSNRRVMQNAKCRMQTIRNAAPDAVSAF
jgi:hypothetical protein